MMCDAGARSGPLARVGGFLVAALKSVAGNRTVVAPRNSDPHAIITAYAVSQPKEDIIMKT